MQWLERSGPEAALGRLCLRLMLALSVAVAAVGADVLPLVADNDASTLIREVTGLYPVKVSRVIVPGTSDEIQASVRSHSGPISIGGGRFSMGGQTATENSLHIDMRRYAKILAFDPGKRSITVQAGATWRDIQDHIDPYHLSVRIMQTYSNFTVGGSLSVNVHGRYVGEGPLIRSVESIKIVLADGREVKASATEQPQLFYAAIGGYGGVGVITEVTLHLAANDKLRRQTYILPFRDYGRHFLGTLRHGKGLIFHNADLYPPAYDTVRVENWWITDKPVTIEKRLIGREEKYWLEPQVISAVSSLPFGAELRKNVIDPLRDRDDVVVWRNHEASYDVRQLEPSIPRLLYSYVLQEYFVPVSKLDAFVPRMAHVLKQYDVNVLNVSIRHALPDTGSFLAWAPEEVFSLVLYYKQGTGEKARATVKQWTQALIDESLAVGGRYYLPYQIHARPDQFRRAYPRFEEFLAVKREVDPARKFRNKLWDAYLPR